MKSPRTRLYLLLTAWAALVAAAALRHTFRGVPPGVVPAFVAALTLTGIVATGRTGWVRDAVDRMSTRTMLGLHVSRFVGAYFLWLYAQGRLPVEFAHRAGWGDIAAATGALALLLWPRATKRRWLLLGWNILGVVDLVVAVGTAGWLSRARPGSMAEIVDFPLLLVPLFAVPAMFISHAVLFRRSFRQADDPLPSARSRSITYN